MFTEALPKEGDLYRKVVIEDHVFELRYGYYEKRDRTSGEPVVIYPDLLERKLYTTDGRRIVTAIQDPCEHYDVSHGRARDECCNDCRHYVTNGADIGMCTHRRMRQKRCKQNE